MSKTSTPPPLKKTTAGENGAASTKSTPASSSSNLGPGPRRFRGDVPAFNPSGQSPHLYTQQMHQYAPQVQPPALIYPAQHPQYFTPQAQFIPYGGQMMPYYPVAMGYPDYSMYQPYQYYAMPAGQFQAPLAYMAMNGMAANGGAGGNGYVPNRKKHFKSHHNNSSNGNSHHNNNNHQHHPSNYYNSNASQSGGLHHPYSKHASASAHSPAASTEAASDDVETRGADVNNSELVPRIDNSANSAIAQPTEPPISKDTPASGAEEKPAVPVAELKTPEQKDDCQTEKDIPEPEHLPVIDVNGSSKEEENTNEAASEDVKEIELPLFFSMTLQELIEGRHSVLELTRKALELKSSHIKEITDADPSKDFHVDTKRSYCIIDHDNGSEHQKLLGSGLPKPANKTNDNETNDSPAPKPTLNWASLLQATAKKTKKPKAQTPSNGESASKQPPAAVSTAPTLTDRYQSLGLLIMSMLYDPSFNLNSCAPFKLNPRGLTNTGNICYMNAVLQCLIFCEPFSRILRLIEEKSLGLLGKTSLIPVLDATINFMNDFSSVNSTSKSAGSSFNSDGIVVGRPLSPEILYMKLVECPKFQHLKWGQQEDAEEFLVYLLDGLHEDFVKAEAAVTAEQMEQLASLYSQKLDSTHAQELKTRMKQAARLVKHTDNKAVEEEPEEAEDERSETGWSEVGGRRKVSSKRVSEVEPSPITSIFGGRFRSVLTVPKSKESHSITVDPYRSILLDISLEDVQTIEDALWKLNEVEKLPYKTEDGIEVVAQKQTYIEDLPEVLTLQLKRFSFQQKQEQPVENGSGADENAFSLFHGVGTIEKVLKNVSYNLDLTVPLEALSPAARNVQNRKYVLTGVIYHHGRNAEGGHYTCDVRRGDNKWLRIDDTAVELIDANAVTEKPDAKDKSAYIFIYQRKVSSGV